MENFGLDLAYSKVIEFKECIGEDVAIEPTQLLAEKVKKRAEWMRSEISEFVVADTLVDQADALTDLLYFVLGTFAELGVAPNRVFDIVHDANMNKLDSDGKPNFDPDGKLLKPDGWLAPETKIADELRKS